MNYYILVALGAWALFGAISIIDKFLLDKPINNAKVYTFYTGAFSFFVILLFLPFAKFGSTHHFLFDLASGLVFLLGQYFLFASIAAGEVSWVIPITGALTPIVSLIFARYYLHATLSHSEFIAFTLLVLGTVVISVKRARTPKHLIFPLLASLFFGIYYVMIKLAYTPFISNFAFVRLGSLIGGVLMLASGDVRRAVFAVSKKVSVNAGGLFITKEVLAGVAFIVLNYAVSLGNPALVNALQGVEYVVLFVFALILTRRFPHILKEESSPGYVLQKSLAILLIVAGLIVLQYH